MIEITSMDQVYQSCLREYMSGVDRSDRDYKSQEIFTPDWMVEYCLNEIGEYCLPNVVCLDQACGDGQFLSRVLISKMLYRQRIGVDIHHSFICSLDEIFGVDIELDNVNLCRQRLGCGSSDPQVADLISRRILIGNCLNPYEYVQGQSTSDHDLMSKYFGSKVHDILYKLGKIA
jgi:hypothetical protein